MPLVVDHLQLWTVGFKWAGLDPDRLWVRIPPDVKDLFSTMLEAILSDHLGCMTLAPEKWDGKDPELAPFYVRYWLDDIHAAIGRQRYKRKLLRHAVLDRHDFREWCERCSISLPEFWFPSGWTDYRYPEEDEVSEQAPRQNVDPDPLAAALASSAPTVDGSPPAAQGQDLRPSQKARIACQVIATNIWRFEPDRTIASVCKDERLKLGDAGYFEEVTVRRWVQEVAPAPVSARRGRPKKKTPPGDD